MDKRKVIDAYRRGILTLQECAQILGLEKSQLTGLLDLPPGEFDRPPLPDEQSVTGNP